MKVNLIPCGPAANDSERKAFALLQGRLSSELGDDHWILLANLAFSATKHRQSDEIDVVVIGPPGVQVIEIKHWTAAWIKRNPDSVEQEANRITLKAKKIATTLRKRIKELPRVDGVFLITEAPAKVSELENQKVAGVQFNTFKTWQRAVGLHASSVLSTQKIQTLAKFLWPKSAVAIDGTLKRFAGYTHLTLQTSPDQGFHRIYKAKHASRQDQVILHLYDLSACDTKAMEKAEREWRALQLLQRYDWAPRIIDSFQDAPGYPGEIKFFTEADPAAPALKERACDDSWDTVARTKFAQNTVQALIDLHSAHADNEPIVHRNLMPATILVKHDSSPILTGFEYARIPLDVSVAATARMTDWDDTVAPEIRDQGRIAADHRSDVYSLCASLVGLFEGRDDELGRKTTEILRLGMEYDPGERSSLSRIQALLSDLLEDTSAAKLPLPTPAEKPPPPAQYWTEEQIIPFSSDKYRIVSRLGSGGVGIAFKVVKVNQQTGEDLGTYVAKVARNKETGQKVLNAYRLAHSHIRHSALSTIFDIAPEWQDNGFIALMSWIEGELLEEYAGLLPLLAEDQQEDSDQALALKWLQMICEALQVLHGNGLMHGDISPRNIMVSDPGVVLIDYDFVTKIGHVTDTPGTVLYCSPSHRERRAATPSDDLYALAASFFHVMFEREPFQYNGVRAKERGLNWSGIEREKYTLLAGFLDQATHPDPEQRFASVADALAALNPSAYETDDQKKALPPQTSERKENEVEWLKSLLQSYPGSHWGNSETRGLDTDFAANTYVETRLEKTLHAAIKNRSVKLVVLCGNAGDGKTALLQHLAERLGLEAETSATRIIKGKLEDGLAVQINLDGSASWQGRSADYLLDKLLNPFQEGIPDKDIVHLLAINDGRLLEWLESVEEKRGETWLTRNLSRLLENNTTLPESRIHFIDLNQRSLVGGVTNDRKSIDSSFLNSLVDSLYGGDRAEEIWSPCHSCSAQERCEVFRANRLFGPGRLSQESVRDQARTRLFEALQAVHLRGKVHITVRELRAALVYILFGVHYCSEYHATSEGAEVSIPFWDRTFSPESMQRQGELLDELPRFDPGLEAQPQIDRYLLHPSRSDDISKIAADDQQNLAALRRHAYFVMTEEKILSLTGDRHALGLAQGKHLRKFRDLAVNDRESEGTKVLIQKLCGGISRLETLPPKALQRPDAVPLRITPRTPTEIGAFWIEKDIGNFCLQVDIADDVVGLDRLHRQAFLIYRYRNGSEERLRLGADLFHMLLELNDGYQLGDTATAGIFGTELPRTRHHL